MTKHSYPLSIKHCRLIDAVALHGGESGASEALNTSKSNISRSLKSAEDALGCKLFYRDRAGFLPTREGSIVIAFCRKLMREIDVVEKSLAGEDMRDLMLQPYLEWRHLEAVYTTANSNSVSAAAKDLGITQSAVSRTLKNLEHLARQPLFKRRSHSLEALEPAIILSRLHRKLETDINGLPRALAVKPGALTGRVFIGILPFATTEIAPRAIGVMSQRHPHLHLQPIQAPFQLLIHQLRMGEVDCIFGIMREPDTFTDLLEIPLFESRYCVVARKDHPVHEQARSIADLGGLQWLVTPHSAPPRIYLEKLYADQGLDPPAQAIETIAFNVNEQILIHSDAVSLMAYREGVSPPLDPRLKIVDIELPNPECVLGLIMQRGQASAPMEEFMNIMQELSPAA